jgi:hypothetical protein
MKKLGSFVDEMEAALTYDQAAREHYGAKAKLNFPELAPQLPAAVNKTTSQYRGKGARAHGPSAFQTPLGTCGPVTVYLLITGGPTQISEACAWGCRGLLDKPW